MADRPAPSAGLGALCALSTVAYVPHLSGRAGPENRSHTRLFSEDADRFPCSGVSVLVNGVGVFREGEPLCTGPCYLVLDPHLSQTDVVCTFRPSALCGLQRPPLGCLGGSWWAGVWLSRFYPLSGPSPLSASRCPAETASLAPWAPLWAFPLKLPSCSSEIRSQA